MRITKMVRCRIRGGRASIFLATCREIKTVQELIPMIAHVGEIIHTAAKVIKVMKECHKAPNNVFLSGILEKIYGGSEKVVLQDLRLFPTFLHVHSSLMTLISAPYSVRIKCFIYR